MNKVVSLAEAASQVAPGAVLALGGMTLYRRPVAFVLALLRQPSPPSNLTLLSFTSSYESDLLVGAGAVSRRDAGQSQPAVVDGDLSRQGIHLPAAHARALEGELQAGGIGGALITGLSAARMGQHQPPAGPFGGWQRPRFPFQMVRMAVPPTQRLCPGHRATSP